MFKGCTQGCWRESDIHCKSELRVNRRTFSIICEMLKNIGGLCRTKLCLLNR